MILKEIIKIFNLKWTILIIFILIILVCGYFAGSYHVVGKTYKKIKNLNQKPDIKLPPIPFKSNEINASYNQLNQYLDRLLIERQKSASEWTSLLQTSSKSEQQKLSAEMRTKFLSFLKPWFSSSLENMDVKTVPWFVKDNVKVSFLKIQTFPGVHLLNILLIPQSNNSLKPAILALHGMYGDISSIVADNDYHHGFGFRLAKEGFIVLAPLRVTSTIESRNTVYLKTLAYGWSLEAIDLWQFVRGLDYLCSMEQVDRGHIGVFGISLGGQQALWLSAIDNRISLALCSGYFADRFDWLFKRASPSAASSPGDKMMDQILPIDNVLYLPSMSFLLDDINLISLVQPRFFGVICGTKDPRYGSAGEQFEKVSRLYNHVGYPQRTAFISFAGGHEIYFGTETIQFINKWLNTEISDTQLN